MSHRKRRQGITWIGLLTALLVIGAVIYQTGQQDAGGAAVGPSPTTPPALEARIASPTPAKTTLTPPARPSPTFTPTSGRTASFDYYVLALSWSPDYCATSGNDDPQQCSLGKKLGFVLHGLWPQYERGYPSNCSTVKLTPDVKAKYAGLYPSPALYDHEWEKHGTCSGLAPDQYLALSKNLKGLVTIPQAYRAPEKPVRVTTAQLRKEFVQANTNLPDTSLAVMCSGSGRFLQELYVCFSVDGQPRACSREIQNEAAKSCQNPDLLVRNVR